VAGAAPGRGVWAGLWSLPEFDTSPMRWAAAGRLARRRRGAAAFVHVLTHLDWTLQPLRWTLPADTTRWPQARIVVPWPAAAGSRAPKRWRWACRRPMRQAAAQPR
jgi:adenine-specific DNA glycosylase